MDTRGFLILEIFILGNVYPLQSFPGRYHAPCIHLQQNTPLTHDQTPYIPNDTPSSSTELWIWMKTRLVANVKCKIAVLPFLFHIQYLNSPKCLDGFDLDHNCAYRTMKSFYFKRNIPIYTLIRYLCRRILSKINREQVQETLVSVCFNLEMSKIILSWAQTGNTYLWSI